MLRFQLKIKFSEKNKMTHFEFIFVQIFNKQSPITNQNYDFLSKRQPKPLKFYEEVLPKFRKNTLANLLQPN